MKKKGQNGPESCEDEWEALKGEVRRIMEMSPLVENELDSSLGKVKKKGEVAPDREYRARL